jgi:hypothetical protein
MFAAKARAGVYYGLSNVMDVVAASSPCVHGAACAGGWLNNREEDKRTRYPHDLAEAGRSAVSPTSYT